MPNRRTVVAGLAATTLAPKAQAQKPQQTILDFKTKKPVPKIGMGTWQTFSIDPSGPELARRRAVLEEFYTAGGGMIDSSPMYGLSETVLGATRNLPLEDQRLFSATKIWTPLKNHGRTQLSDSHRLWQEPVLDLVYVHNLLGWKDHLKTLQDAKQSGTVRFIGLTTSHGRRHKELEKLIQSEPIDAVQLTYNLLNRRAEERLLPLIQDKGLALIINRPFMGGHLFNHIKGHDLPEWSIEALSIKTWAEFFLKFVISHPAVDYAIPATSNPDHMVENMRARLGPMPDAKMREQMAVFMAGL